MKIFSLETKKHLLGWSVVLGFVINICITFLLHGPGPGKIFWECENERQQWEATGVMVDYIQPCSYNQIGWPLKIPYLEPNWGGLVYSDTIVLGGLFINTIIWIILLMFILSLGRHFRKKNYQNITKES